MHPYRSICCSQPNLIRSKQYTSAFAAFSQKVLSFQNFAHSVFYPPKHHNHRLHTWAFRLQLFNRFFTLRTWPDQYTLACFLSDIFLLILHPGSKAPAQKKSEPNHSYSWHVPRLGTPIRYICLPGDLQTGFSLMGLRNKWELQARNRVRTCSAQGAVFSIQGPGHGLFTQRV